MPRDRMNLFMNGILLLLAALLMPQTEAAVMRGKFENPAHPGKCFVTAQLILNPSQTAKYPNMDCARIICESNSMAQIHTCGVQGAPPGFKLSEPKFPNADYPKCCERDIVPQK